MFSFFDNRQIRMIEEQSKTATFYISLLFSSGNQKIFLVRPLETTKDNHPRAIRFFKKILNRPSGFFFFFRLPTTYYAEQNTQHLKLKIRTRTRARNRKRNNEIIIGKDTLRKSAKRDKNNRNNQTKVFNMLLHRVWVSPVKRAH